MAAISIRDVSLFVKVIGQGYPLLIMYGGPGADQSTLLPFRPLRDQFTLIFYALRYPQSLSHLLLVDTCGDTHWVQHNAPEILAKRGFSDTAVQIARRFFNGELNPGEVLPAMMKFGKACYYHLNLLEFVHMMVAGIRVKIQPEAQIFGFKQLLRDWSVMDRLAEIKVPTLVLAGRHDFQFPPEHQAMLAAGIPNAQLEIIERADHNAPIEGPSEVIKVVRSFMATR